MSQHRGHQATEYVSHSKSIYVIETPVNFYGAMALLSSKGMRPLVYTEALYYLTNGEALKQRLKGKWFHVDGEIAFELGPYVVSGEELEPVAVHNPLTREANVFAWTGQRPVLLKVLKDEECERLSRRFELYANAPPTLGVSTVVGVRALKPPVDLRRE